MIVSLYTTKNPIAQKVEVSTFSDLRSLVGGDIEVVATQSGSSTVLRNEDGPSMGLPRNAHFNGIVGDVVVAPKGWQNLPNG